jgi:acyl transferase domain-containing protein
MSRAFVRGVAVDWARVLGGGAQVDLPTYPFQRQRYWPEGRTPGTAARAWAHPVEARFWAAVEGGDVDRADHDARGGRRSGRSATSFPPCPRGGSGNATGQ